MKAEPAQMTKAYFSPMMYPKPSSAAPVLHVRTTLAFSTAACPHEVAAVVIVPAQKPKVSTT